MIKQYREAGFKLLRVYKAVGTVCSCESGARCPAPGKHPAAWQGVPHRGVYNATLDYTESDFAKYNVGIATGEGLMVVDIDPRNGGHDTWQHITSGESLPETMTVETGGGGFHIYYSIPHDFHMRNITVRGVDFQYNSKFVVAPPSIHASGKEYVMQDFEDGDKIVVAQIPEFLKSYLREQFTRCDSAVREPVRNAIAPTSYEWRWVLEVLRELPADLPYSQWIGVGMGLHATGRPDALDVWDDWSAKGDKYRDGECKAKWSTFRVGGDKVHTFRWVFAMADLYGIKYGKEEDDFFASYSSVRSDSVCAGELAEQGGELIHGLYESCLGAAHKPIPSFALGCALSVLSSLVQGRYRTPMGGSLNLYQWFIAPAGYGKDSYYKWVSETIREINPWVLGTEFGSLHGWRLAIGRYNSKCLVIDEFHDLLWRMQDKRAADYMRAFLPEFKALWNTPKQIEPQVIKGNVTAGVAYPCLSLCGFGTVSGFELVASEQFLTSGLGSRFVFWKQLGDEFVPRQIVSADSEISQELLAKLRAVAGKVSSEDPYADIAKAQEAMKSGKGPVVINYAAKVLPQVVLKAGEWLGEVAMDEDLRAHEYRRDESLYALYQRMFQQSLRLASLRCISMGRDEIDEADYRWGNTIAMKSADSFSHGIEQRTSVTNQDEDVFRRAKALRKVLEKSDKPLTRRELHHKISRMARKNLEETILHLSSTGDIVVLDKSNRAIYPDKLDGSMRFLSSCRSFDPGKNLQ